MATPYIKFPIRANVPDPKTDGNTLVTAIVDAQSGVGHTATHASVSIYNADGTLKDQVTVWDSPVGGNVINRPTLTDDDLSTAKKEG